MIEKIVFVRPILVVALYVSVFFAGMISNQLLTPNQLWSGIIISLIGVLFQMCWAVSTRFYLSGSSNEKSRFSVISIIFFVGLTGYLLLSTGLLLLSLAPLGATINIQVYMMTVGLVFGNLSAFTLIGIAAYTLEKAEKGSEAGVWNHIGSFFQIFYFPIGIWFLNKRIRKLKPPN